MRISQIDIRTIQDSRGKDTLRATMTSNGTEVISSVPAGKSKGKHEAVTVMPRIAFDVFCEIKEKILSVDFQSVSEFDKFLLKLDGTPDKSKLGGNLILVLSISFTKLLAKVNNLQTHQLISKMIGKKPKKFPYLYLNMIGGGLHAVDSLPFQEYLLVTKHERPSEGLQYAKLVVERLRKDIMENFGELKFGDEGTVSIKSDNPEVGLEVLCRNLTGTQVSAALDVAASSFYTDKKEYKIGLEVLNASKMIDFYRGLASKFPLLSIEDPFAEDDGDGFSKLCATFKDSVWIIGDDLTVTNKNLIKKAVNKKQITGVIIKPNQIGSVTETLEAIQFCQSHNIKTIVSHRSGETNDDFVADLAFGVEADGLKSGAPTQPQRMAKYNRLIEIEKSLNVV